MAQLESPFNMSFLGGNLDPSTLPPLQIVRGKDKAVSSLTLQPPPLATSNPASKGMAELMNDIIKDATKDAAKATQVANATVTMTCEDAAKLISAMFQEMMKPENIGLWLKTVPQPVSPELINQLANIMMQTASGQKK